MQFKLKLVVTGLLLTALCGLTACNKDAPSAEAPIKEELKLVIGASSTPHAEILEFVQPILAKQGVNLEIIKFNDYILPNVALAADELDANFFQHMPYLEQTLRDHANDPTYDFVNAGPTFITPIGVYSSKHKSLADLPDNALIVTSSNVAERGRVLSMFVNAGLLTIKPGVKITAADFADIADNPRKLRFKGDVEPALMPQIYRNGEGDAQIINANFAIVSGLNPVTDPIEVEGQKDNPYANIIVVRQKNINNPAVKALAAAVQLPETKNFMLEKFKGAVVPAS